MSSSKAAPQIVAIIVLAILAFALGLYVARSSNEAPPDIEGLLWPAPPQLSAFSLTDIHGKPFTENALVGKWTLLFFGFTHCPDVCPTTMKTLHIVAERLRENPSFQATGQVLFVTVDPARDTPAVVRDYVHYFDPNFLGATGNDEELKSLARQIGIVYVQVKTADPKIYSVDHTASIFLLTPKLQLVSVLSPPFEVSNLIERIQTIIDFIEG